MSARQRKRILEQLQSTAIEDLPNDTETESDDETDSEIQNIAQFSLLESSDESESDSDSSGKHVVQSHDQPSTGAKKRTTGRYRQAKKGKAGQRDTISNNETLEQALHAFSSHNRVLNDFMLHTVSIWNGLLTINRSHLNPRNELSRKFGEFVDVAQDRRAIERVSRPHQQRRNTNKTRGRFANVQMLVSPKPEWRAPPNFANGGITMRLTSTVMSSILHGISTDENIGSCETQAEERAQRDFVFKYANEYENRLRAFSAQLGMFPEEIMQHIARNSESDIVDENLQIAELFRATGQVEAADVQLEKAIFILTHAFHPQFKPWEAICRCRWSHVENRAFFTALFRRQSAVGRVGAVRTSLELGKLLLSLDPERDPMKILLSLPYMAIRSECFEWLIRLSEPSLKQDTGDQLNLPFPMHISLGLRCNKSTDASVAFLPNLAYMRALAWLRMANPSEQPTAIPCEANRLTFGLLPYDNDQEQYFWKATTALLVTILLFPHVVPQLLSSIGINEEDVGTQKVGRCAQSRDDIPIPDFWSDRTNCQFSALFHHEHFINTNATSVAVCNTVEGELEISAFDMCDEYHRLCTLLAAHQNSCWKDSDTLAWLYNVSLLACTAVDVALGAESNIPHSNMYKKQLLGLFEDEIAICEAVGHAAMLRSCLYATSGYPEAPPDTLVDVNKARAELRYYGNIAGTDFISDTNVVPINPEQFENFREEDAIAANQGLIGGRPQNVDLNQNALTLFWQTLLPWNFVGDTNTDRHEDEEH